MVVKIWVGTAGEVPMYLVDGELCFIAFTNVAPSFRRFYRAMLLDWTVLDEDDVRLPDAKAADRTMFLCIEASAKCQ